MPIASDRISSHADCTGWEYLFVSTHGDDEHSGDTWATALQTIQEGLELAREGDQILIGHGTYYQDIRTVRMVSWIRLFAFQG
ncbi:MAG: hypothetical protein HC808_00030 [Candidatus Competibacteraceae bacterium]|nr:hypothetical protein [Candidatus Competibacteraceae bacterium]